jgi:hypothetical protein
LSFLLKYHSDIININNFSRPFPVWHQFGIFGGIKVIRDESTLSPILKV